jgi:hypothetical protein
MGFAAVPLIFLRVESDILTARSSREDICFGLVRLWHQGFWSLLGGSAHCLVFLGEIFGREFPVEDLT